MNYTMRSAFIKWKQLHNEKIVSSSIRIPNWFRWYIRNNCNWEYANTSSNKNYFRMSHGSDIKNGDRAYKGFYRIEISDFELLELNRSEWVK